jgi:WD40 repeat protein
LQDKRFSRGRYSGSWDCNIRAWDIGTGQCKRVFSGHRSWVLSLCVWGDRLYSGSQESIVRVWDIKSGECISALEGHEDAIQNVLVALDSDRRKKKDTDTIDSTPPASATLNTTNEFHLGSGELFTASKDKTIKAWDLAVGRSRHEYTVVFNIN